MPVELAAAKEFNEVAGLAPLDLLMTLDLAHKRGRVCVRGGNSKDEILLRTAGAGNGGAYLLKGRRGTGGDPQGLPVLVLL